MSSTTKLQIAVDVTDEKQALGIAGLVDTACNQGLLDCKRIILEAGTPLIKMYGMSILSRMKLASPKTKLMADLKTADVGRLEAELAYSFSADSVSVLAAAPFSTIRSVLITGKDYGRGVVIDFLGVSDLRARSKRILEIVHEINFPTENLVFEFHRGIDEERGISVEEFFGEVADVAGALKKTLPELSIAVAGGITPQLKREIEQTFKADIYVVGRYITSNPTIDKILEFL
ncbi:MAG: orotidine 5'-phosphate decarboxylase / HUMPS family protein [Infirmifilum sp.]